MPTHHGQKLPIHLNNAVCCAIDIETTGLSIDKHEVVEVAFIPLNSEWRPMTGLTPFVVDIKPENTYDITYGRNGMSRPRVAEIINEGYDQFAASDLFERWFHEHLKMPELKKIMPLASNWPFDRMFLQKWLGKLAFNEFIDARYRDTMSLASSINDAADLRGEVIPYEKVSLVYLANLLKVDYPVRHRALPDAACSAEVYRRLLRELKLF
jgi:DNA polymerase III epsilon subunit-like protein